jgi:hypothetical protein
MLQALADAELEDSTFIWHPETNLVHITFDVFRKKRARAEDVSADEDTKVIFEVEGSQCPGKSTDTKITEDGIKYC